MTITSLTSSSGGPGGTRSARRSYACSDSGLAVISASDVNSSIVTIAPKASTSVISHAAIVRQG